MKDKMKKAFVISVATMCGLVTLCSCHGDVLNDYEQTPEPTSVLHVFTRSDDPTVASTVPTPVSLYVFNANNKCVGLLNDVTQNALVPLAGGTYDVYAIAGADATRYDLPTETEVAKTSVVTLKTGQTLGELTTSHATVTVADAAEHTLTLSLARAVMGVKQMSIKKVPSTVTAVSVTVAPLYESLVLDGTYSGTAGSMTVSLSEEADGTTWSFAGGDDGPFFFPSVGKPTITVNFTTADGTKGYSYAVPEELSANHKLSIDGTYTEQAKLKITGTITGSEWGSDQTVSFEFDESSSSGTTPGSGSESGGESGSETGGGETSQTVTLPNVGDKYKGEYYVLSVDNTKNEILVLSPNSKVMGINPNTTTDTSDAIETLETALRSWEETPIGTWSIPSAADIRLFVEQRTEISRAFPGGNKQIYCYNDAGVLSCTMFQNTTLNIQPYSNTTTSTSLLPVAKVTVTGSN